MSSQLPDLLTVLSPLFAQCAPDEQRILLAMLERLAAEHYRRWADEVSDPPQKQGLLAAAAREVHIAEVAESLEPHAEQIAKTLWDRFPNIRSLYADAMRPMTLIEQWTVQSAGEHGGSQLWRSFAEAEPNPAVRAKLLACSEEDEENSRFLADTLKAMGVVRFSSFPPP
jgi:hypothetical protein